MTSVLQIKRRINGAAGSPAAAGAKEGELALNFPKAAGASDKPELWAFDGVGYRRVNPDTNVTVGVAALAGGTAGSATGIGAAYTALASKPTDPIIIATYAGTAYVKTGAGGGDGDWTALGAATSFATAAEVIAGVNATKAINPAVLRGGTVAAPTGGAGPVSGDADKIVRLGSAGFIDPALLPRLVSTDSAVVTAGAAINGVLTPAGLESRVARAPNATPANDAGKIPALDAKGLIPAGFLPIGGLNFSGSLDPTVAAGAGAPAGAVNGQFYTVTKAGAIDAAWKPFFANAGLTTVAIGDYMVWDDTAKKFHHVANAVDMSAYVPLAGTTAMAGNILWSGAAGNKNGTVILNGKGGTIDAVVIDGGTY